MVAERLEANGRVQTALRNRNVLEGGAEAGAVLGVENLPLLNVEAAADDITLFEARLAELFAGVGRGQITNIGESVPVGDKAVAIAPRAERLVSLLHV